jgi:hypothetical protein
MLSDLQQRLAASESKRAELIAEVARLNDQLMAAQRQAPVGFSPLRGAASSSSPHRAVLHALQSPEPGGDVLGGSPRAQTADAINMAAALQDELRESERKRVQLVKDMEQQKIFYEERLRAGERAGQAGTMTIGAMPQAGDDDFGFDEEDDARQRAEEVMAKLLRALHTQRQAQEQLAQAQLEIADMRSQLEQSRGRELLLGNMVKQYHEARQSQAAGASALVSGSAGSTAKGVTFANADALLQEAIANVTRADGVRRRLTETKLDEAMRENMTLRAQLNEDLHSGGSLSKVPLAAGGTGASSSTRMSPGSFFGAADEALGGNSDLRNIVAPLISDERAALLEYARREQLLMERFGKLRAVVLEKDRAIKDLQILLKAHSQGGK